MAQYGHPIIPNHHFAYVSSECQLLFKSRYYYGSIALCQTVAEALARFMYESWIGNKPASSFETNIRRMREANVQPDVTDLLTSIYGGRQRHDFHHLNKTVPRGHATLRRLATEKVDLLNKVELRVFGFQSTEKGLNPAYPKYWRIVDGKFEVFLKIHP